VVRSLGASRAVLTLDPDDAVWRLDADGTTVVPPRF
jgi:hypothetical protein